MGREAYLEKFGVPGHPFLYTIPQICEMLNLPEDRFKRQYCYFEGIHTGRKPSERLKVHNIQPQVDEPPDWRVSERELFRWLRYMGFRVVERVYIKD